jgi:hypothetical protein
VLRNMLFNTLRNTAVAELSGLQMLHMTVVHPATPSTTTCGCAIELLVLDPVCLQESAALSRCGSKHQHQCSCWWILQWLLSHIGFLQGSGSTTPPPSTVYCS